jgi:molecular chaperone DnaK
MPRIQERVGKAVGRLPSSGVHPDLVVAVGAAIQGSLLVAATPGFALLDVTPHNLGIMGFGGFAETLIAKDTTIPTESKRVFTTARDRQDTVKIVVFQGDSRRIEKNDVLGEFTLTGIRPAPRGEVKIEVTFAISADGIVSVSARDLDTGHSHTIQVSGSQRLEDDEIKRMISEHTDNLLSAIEEEAAPALASPTETGDGQS